MSHNAKELPSKEELENQFTYDNEQGVLLSNKTKREIRRQDASGYLIVTIGGKVRRANRVIWKMVTGEDPDGIVDYKDGDPLNNSFENLQVVSEEDFYVNKKERELLSNNTTNTGVSYYRRTKTWRVQLRIGGETYSKYGFTSENDAIAHAKEMTLLMLDSSKNKEKKEEEKRAREEIINDLFE